MSVEMIERADEPAAKERSENRDKGKTSNTARSQTRESRDQADLEKTLENLFDGMRPTKRFGKQKASEKIEESYNEIRDSSKPIEFEDVRRAVERGKFNRRKWDDVRASSEVKLHEVKTEYEADIAEIAGEIGKDLARAEKWSRKNIEDYEEIGKTYEFEDHDDLTAVEFIELASKEMESIDLKYTSIQEDLAELGQEVEEKRFNDTEADRSQVKGLGTDSERILRYENKALSYRFDEDLYKRIKDKDKHKKRLQNRFLSRKKDIKEVYNEHTESLETYITERMEGLNETAEILENISTMKPAKLEDLIEENYSRKIPEHLLENGEEQLRKQYQRTVKSLENKVEKQYNQLEKPVSELEELEDSLPDDYFSNMRGSEELRDTVRSQAASTSSQAPSRIF